MTSNQENMRSMIGQVTMMLEEYEEKTAGLPHFGEYFEALKAAVTKFDEYAVLQLRNAKGATETKRERLLEMAEMAVNVASRARAYAMQAGDEVLMAQMRLNKWGIVKMRDTEAGQQSRWVLGKARELSEVLAEYGVDAGLLDGLEECVSRYEEMLSQPRTVISKKKSFTTGLSVALKEAADALKMMDALVEMLKWDDEGFYGRYRSARKVVDHSHRRVALKLVVMDEATGQRLATADVEMEHTADESNKKLLKGEKIVRRMRGNGGMHQRKMGAGTWKLKVSYPGYAVKEMVFYVVKGLTTRLEVGLEKG